jgi:hypothetical protein
MPLLRLFLHSLVQRFPAYVRSVSLKKSTYGAQSVINLHSVDTLC